MSPRFFQYSYGFPGFLGPILRSCPTVESTPKKNKKAKSRFLIKIRKRLFHFLETGREIKLLSPSTARMGELSEIKAH